MRTSRIAALTVMLLAAPAFGDDVTPLTGDALSGTVSGNTIEGSMLDGTVYSEYYDPDGTIRGEGYQGSYRFEENAMCFSYPDTDEACYGVGLDTEGGVRWLEDGEIAGDGLLKSGNPNGW